ncbi:GNAT family N-acetyltransferase [Mucilaginibacter dorajii]|uniref:GNAT family N-acetyltransferase n=1 Tax=Mucilaginibacter dorajii TaxID=692994 RepID=A0ABP7QVQ2_9SPHI|nr:GNAT family N-acetyltransferase [Mucilaginibacter dorajii]MCS3735686.1 phosphinothricin acetyltransferase [Mucilaginibacter dorajii]
MEKENSSLIIRLASPTDAGGILDIYNHAILNTTSVYSYEPHSLAMRLAWLEDKNRSNIPVFIAEVAGVVAGFATYGPFRVWPAYQYTIEHSVYVHHDYRQRGIAQKLLEKLIETVMQKQMHTIIAGIDAGNTASIKLHQKFGFTEVGTFKQVGYKFNHWLDLKFMQLILNNNFQPGEK